MTLTLEEANRIAEGAMEHARSLDILVCVAVCDAGGRLVSFQRMDGAIWAAVYGSQGKAVGVRRLRPPERRSHRAGRPPHLPRHRREADGGHMILGRGGVPIVRDGPGNRRLRGRRRHRRGGRGLRARRRRAHLSRKRARATLPKLSRMEDYRLPRKLRDLSSSIARAI